jgi:hypothetical protein
MPFAATRLDKRTSIGFPCRRRAIRKGHGSILQWEHTLSLNALFAPEDNGRGALGPDAGAFEAILKEAS